MLTPEKVTGASDLRSKPSCTKRNSWTSDCSESGRTTAKTSLENSAESWMSDCSESTFHRPSWIAGVMEGTGCPQEPSSSSHNEEITPELINDFRRGVVLKDRRWRLRMYRRVFTGSDAVDFLVRSKHAASREEAVQIGKLLEMDFELFEHVSGSHEFDDGQMLFRFKDDENDDSSTKDRRKSRSSMCSWTSDCSYGSSSQKSSMKPRDSDIMSCDGYSSFAKRLILASPKGDVFTQRRRTFQRSSSDPIGEIGDTSKEDNREDSASVGRRENLRKTASEEFEKNSLRMPEKVFGVKRKGFYKVVGLVTNVTDTVAIKLNKHKTAKDEKAFLRNMTTYYEEYDKDGDGIDRPYGIG